MPLLGAGISSVQKDLGQKDIPHSRRYLLRDTVGGVNEELLERPLHHDHSVAKWLEYVDDYEHKEIMVRQRAASCLKSFNSVCGRLCPSGCILAASQAFIQVLSPRKRFIHKSLYFVLAAVVPTSTHVHSTAAD